METPWHQADEFRYVGSIEGGMVLQHLASLVNLSTFACHPRAEKKTRFRLKRQRPAKRPHVSTAKILWQTQAKKLTP